MVYVCLVVSYAQSFHSFSFIVDENLESTPRLAAGRLRLTDSGVDLFFSRGRRNGLDGEAAAIATLAGDGDG